jgi:hypothetical protein
VLVHRIFEERHVMARVVVAPAVSMLLSFLRTAGFRYSRFEVAKGEAVADDSLTLHPERRMGCRYRKVETSQILGYKAITRYTPYLAYTDTTNFGRIVLIGATCSRISLSCQ